MTYYNGIKRWMEGVTTQINVFVSISQCYNFAILVFIVMGMKTTKTKGILKDMNKAWQKGKPSSKSKLET